MGATGLGSAIAGEGEPAAGRDDVTVPAPAGGANGCSAGRFAGNGAVGGAAEGGGADPPVGDGPAAVAPSPPGVRDVAIGGGSTRVDIGPDSRYTITAAKRIAIGAAMYIQRPPRRLAPAATAGGAATMSWLGV